jgi:hypothetical protein
VDTTLSHARGGFDEEKLGHLVAVIGICIAVSTPAHVAAQAGQWQTPAKRHHTLKKAEPGTLTIDADGVEFRSAKFSHRWKYLEIHTFDLSSRKLTLLTYENRAWREPGERPFRFTLGAAMPPDVAAQFTDRVGKPVRNGAPLPSAKAIAEIAAHRRGWSGGGNGTLRLKDDGIDYVSDNGRNGRSWRWADIQTLANPNPYELRVTAFREIVEFDLKQPLSRDLFERMWDHLYASGLNTSEGHRDIHEEIHQ